MENELPHCIAEARAEVLQKQISRMISLYCESALTSDEARREEIPDILTTMMLDELTCAQFSLIGDALLSLVGIMKSASLARATLERTGQHSHENCIAEVETYRAIAELNGEEF